MADKWKEICETVMGFKDRLFGSAGGDAANKKAPCKPCKVCSDKRKIKDKWYVPMNTLFHPSPVRIDNS